MCTFPFAFSFAFTQSEWNLHHIIHVDSNHPEIWLLLLLLKADERTIQKPKLYKTTKTTAAATAAIKNWLHKICALRLLHENCIHMLHISFFVIFTIIASVFIYLSLSPSPARSLVIFSMSIWVETQLNIQQAIGVNIFETHFHAIVSLCVCVCVKKWWYKPLRLSTQVALPLLSVCREEREREKKVATKQPRHIWVMTRYTMHTLNSAIIFQQENRHDCNKFCVDFSASFHKCVCLNNCGRNVF